MQLPTTPSFTLENKRALVTGASRGIGLAAAVALAEAGAHVTLAARSIDDLEAAAAAIRERCTSGPGSADVLVLDVGDPASIESAIGSLPALDILVNNAGTARHATMVDVDMADFDAVMNVNLRGAFHIAKLVVAGLSLIHI